MKITPRLFRRPLAAALLATTLITPTAIGEGLPDLGDVAQASISPQQERKMGEMAVRQLRASGGVLDDPEINAYLNELGYRLVAASSDARQDFEFFAVNDFQVNAFAMPGGFVGINLGLLLTTQSESELAAVLAHEISHVTQRHIVRSLVAQNRNTMLALGAMVAAILASRGGGQGAEAAIATTQAALIQSQISFTRENEYEADRIGFQVLDRAGFDTRSMGSFLERMQRATRVYDTKTPNYLRTHPITYERIAEAQNRSNGQPYRQIKDSQDFHLVRALARSYQGTAKEAVAYFEESLAEKKYNDERATRYGLVAAHLRGENYTAAMAAMKALRAMRGPRHPMIDALEAKVLADAGRYPEALAVYDTALRAFPSHRQLLYDYPDTLLKAKQPKTAEKFLTTQLATYPSDGTLHRLAAQTYAALGRKTLQHQHQGEFYASKGNLKGAVDQFEIARKANDGDFYQMSAVEARLRDLRKALTEWQKEQRDLGETG